jgi:hypothetical protein
METKRITVNLTPEEIRDLPTTPVELVTAKESMTLGVDDDGLFVTLQDGPQEDLD